PFSEIGANAPLASYDVESGGVDEVLHRTGPHSQPGYAAQGDMLDGGGTLAMEGSMDFAGESFGAPPMASRRGGHMAVPLPPAPTPYQQPGYDPQTAGYPAPQAGYAPYDTGQYAEVPVPADPAPPVAPATPQGAGIRHEVAEGDNQTHYDLGVAYMEMGMEA